MNPPNRRSHTDSIGTAGKYVSWKNAWCSLAKVVDTTHGGASFTKPLNSREQKMDPDRALAGSTDRMNPQKRRNHTDSILTTGGHVSRKNP